MPDLPSRHLPAKIRKPYENSRTRGNRLSGRALQRRNDRIKLRDQYTCQACGLVSIKGNVDHHVPLAEGGDDLDQNLRWLCLDCHAIKSKAEAMRGIRKAGRTGATNTSRP